MNVGIVTAWFPSGAGVVSKQYEKTLKIAHDVYIYCRGGSARNQPEWNGKNVTWAYPHPASTGIYRWHFNHWIKNNNLDLVIFNEQRYWKPVIWAKKRGILVGAYIDYYTADTIPFFKLYDFLICNTKRHHKVFCDFPQSIFIKWGTLIKQYSPVIMTPIRPTTFIISAGWDGLYASSTPWMDRKGIGVTLRAFTRVKGNCKLIVLSQVPLEKCPKQWDEIIRVDPRIEFQFGSHNKTPYNLGDIYVYPSRLDGIGLTLTEALSCGLPAITTDNAPMNEFVQHNINGFLVDVEEFRGRPDGYYWAESICDEDCLKDAIQRYIDNPDLILDHSINARRIAEEQMDWEKNSYFLNDWITKISRINYITDGIINGVDIRAVESYDRKLNPKPLQYILVGIKRLLYQISQLTHHLLYS